jgi:hypothetical protein
MTLTSLGQQNAVRRLDVAVLRPVLEGHLVTGECFTGPQPPGALDAAHL